MFVKRFSSIIWGKVYEKGRRRGKGTGGSATGYLNVFNKADCGVCVPDVTAPLLPRALDSVEMIGDIQGQLRSGMAPQEVQR